MSDDGHKMAQVNFEEINEETGFKRADEFVWNAFEKTSLNGGEDADTDPESWADNFVEECERDGVTLDSNFVKSICTLGIYAGLRDEFSQRSGSGKAIYNNGDRYEGEFFQDKKHGTGQYIWVSKGKNEADRLVEKEVQRAYGGNVSALDEAAIADLASKFQFSKSIVAGIVEYGLFPCHHGDYVRGKRTGRGIMKNKDATIYKGEFLENKREGQGVFYYLNGDIFSGNWKGGLKHGFGTYHFPDGGEYRGEWVSGVFTHGQWILPDGTYYEGKFDKKNRPLDGAASMHYPSLAMAQNGVFKRGVWAPTSELIVCEEMPVDGMAWTD